MITKRVVLVLGAGASKPYGFPLAAELMRSAVILDGNPRDMLRRARFEDEGIATFTDQLRDSQLPSIDAFLEYRPEFTKIGKALIAYYLIPHEDPKYLLDLTNQEHWYQYLYHQMKAQTLEEFKKNLLSIVTFNYDRSFEYYLGHVLAATHRASPDSVLEALHSIPVVHVHGSLGPLPGSGEDPRPYQKDLTSTGLLAAASSIRIVSETVPQDAQFKKARTLLSKAEIVLFLGFGYHRQNVERLIHSGVISGNCRVDGTTLGFTQSEYDHNVSPLFRGVPGFGLERNDFTVLDFLRNNLHLLVGP